MVLKDGRASVEMLAERLGWRMVDESETELEGGDVAHEVVWDAGPSVSVQYSYDPLSGSQYVVVWGSTELAELVEHDVAVWSLDELLSDHSRESIARAGVGAPDEYDERFFTLITAALKDPDTAVREAALYATAYSAYPQYRDALTEVARTDPDPARQVDADMILESLD
jgi:hypothetical protein